MRVSTKIVGLLATAMLLGSGSCILACGCGRPPNGMVRGSVRTEAAQGVPGAALELRSQGSSGVTQVTGADGGFAFGGVGGQGNYTLTVQPPAGWSLAPGQAPSASLWVGAEDTVTVDFILRAP
jgi:Carboxypeptidase regulatory-like domain